MEIYCITCSRGKKTVWLPNNVEFNLRTSLMCSVLSVLSDNCQCKYNLVLPFLISVPTVHNFIFFHILNNICFQWKL